METPAQNPPKQAVPKGPTEKGAGCVSPQQLLALVSGSEEPPCSNTSVQAETPRQAEASSDSSASIPTETD